MIRSKRIFATSEAMIDGERGNMEILMASRANIQERMTAVGSHIRDPKKVKTALKEAWNLYHRMETMKIPSSRFLPFAFRNRDICLTHILFLEAMKEYLAKGGLSRGSYLVVDPKGEPVSPSLDDQWNFRLTDVDDFVNTKILEVRLEADLVSGRTGWTFGLSLPRKAGLKMSGCLLKDKIVRS